MKKRFFSVIEFTIFFLFIFVSVAQIVQASSLKYVGYYGSSYDCYYNGNWQTTCLNHISEFAPYTNIMDFAVGWDDEHMGKGESMAKEAKDNGMKVVLWVDACFFAGNGGYYMTWDNCKTAIDEFYNQGNLYAFYFDESGWNAYSGQGWLTITDSSMAAATAKLNQYYPDVRIMITEVADPNYFSNPFPNVDIYSVDYYGVYSESYISYATSLYNSLKSSYSGDIWVTTMAFGSDSYPLSVEMARAWYNLAASDSRYSGLYWYRYADDREGVKGARNYPDVLAYNRQVGLSILCSNNWESNPVCGANGVNYANPDLAKCAGTTIANYGSCTTSPTISFTSPANGATISGTLSATTSPSTGVVNIKYYIDGSYLFDEQNAPYGFTLDTTAYANGAHILKAVAYNSAGYTGEASITVTFSNLPPTIYSFTANPTSISFGQSSTLSWSTNGATGYSINGVTVTGNSKIVSPSVNTTYTLNASNAAGGTTKTITVIVTTSTCTSWTYSAWGTCSSLGNQTRTFLTSSPTGCTGGSPILSQSCTYTPLCTESNWNYTLSPSTCPSNGLQTKTWTKTGSCSGGTSHPTSETVYCTPGVQTCTSWTYSSWGTCSSSGNQTRTVTSSSPTGCTGGSSVTSQSCTYTPLCTESNWNYILSPSTCPSNGLQTKTWTKTGSCSGGTSHPTSETVYCTPGVQTCTSWTYSSWGTCSSLGNQTRTFLTSSPTGCTGGSPIISRSCGLCTESDWTYTLYPEICPPEGFQTKRWDKEGECSGGVHRPDPKRISCNPGVLTCVYFDYTGWSPCFSEIQTRTVISSFPEDCIGGDPKLSRSCCEGCDFSTKCYSVGYRLSSNYPKYCSENKEFVLQLESGSACNNNFECKSNLCSSGKCTYPGVFNKFIRWLKKLFS